MIELSTQIEDERARRAVRTIVVGGAGPTGIELAGALSELVRKALPKDYPGLTFDDVSVIVLEAADRVLSGFPDELAQAAKRRLEQKHVDIRLNSAVAEFDGHQVTLKSGEVIPASTLIWAAGVRSVSMLDKLGLKQARQGRVVVDRTLQVPGYPEVFVIGDAAYLEDDGKPLPMMAPVAIQQGKLAARNLRRLIEAKPLEQFIYRDPGSLATIGRNAAVARVKNFKFEGFLAWLVWLAVHLFWLIGFRNRLLVMINWAWDYFLFERTVRLITPDGRKETEEHPWLEDLAALGVYNTKDVREFERRKV
jgi:NADH dehydrogenase